MLNLFLSSGSFVIALSMYNDGIILGAISWLLISGYFFLCKIVIDLEREHSGDINRE